MSGAAEFVLAGVPALDLCRKYIKEGRALWSSIKNAQIEVSERFVRLGNSWVRLVAQLNFFQHIQHMMEEEHREVYEQTLFVLQNKIEIVVAILRELVTAQSEGEELVAEKMYKVKRGKYAIKKSSLDAAIGELELWQGLADQSWFLLLKIASPQIDSALRICGTDAQPSPAISIPSTRAIRAGLRNEDGVLPEEHVTLDPSYLKTMAIQNIDFCDNLMLATRTHSDGSVSKYILNQLQCEFASKKHIFRNNARDLVRKLQHDEPFTFGLLKCKGFTLSSTLGGAESPLSLTLVFWNPLGTQNPRSLRDILISASPNTSISRRLEIAQGLAKSVGYVHTFGFVHKNIRPESVLIFESASGEGMSAFLVGFDSFRKDEGWTQRRGDDVPERNLYRHASRQGFNPSEYYEMRHDIYSLGVCLLEIGLWSSFVEYDAVSKSRSLATLLSSASGATNAQSSTTPFESGKDVLLSLARSHLPGSMGDKYTKIVETCLTCLDPNNADFGDEREFLDEAGILVGARYVDKVLLRLNLLCM